MTALLVVDFETTSLDVETATLLEVAWAITDMDGLQRTPIRSRYLEIAPRGVDSVCPAGRGMGLRRWHPASGGCAQRAALTMAEESGLHDDWSQCPSQLRVTHSTELQRFLLDDIAATCDPGDPAVERKPETVHVCGLGAARFDYSILALHCPNLVRAGSKYPVHYRPVDMSGNQTGLLGGNHTEELIKWGVGEYGEEIAFIALGTAPQYAYGDDAVMAWLVDGAGQHRAVPDVARAIVAQRALWRYGAGLRAALGASGG